MSERPQDQRDRMNARYLQLRGWSKAEFWHDGLGFREVPGWGVSAYVAALEDGLDPVDAIASAFIDGEPVGMMRAVKGWLGWHVAHAYVWRLQRIAASLDGSNGAAA